MALDLQELGEWKSNLDAFMADSQFEKIFGKYFQGLATPVNDFLEVLDYYEKIDTQLEGPDATSVRLFLRTGEYETMLSIPQIDDEHPIRNWATLTHQECETLIQTKEAELKSLVEVYGKVSKVSRIFVQKVWTNFTLLNFVNRLSSFLTTWKNLDSSQEMEALLGPYFNGAKTDSRRLENTLLIVSILGKWPNELRNRMISIAQKGTLPDLSKALTSIEDRLRESSEALNTLMKVTAISYDEPVTAEIIDDLSNYLLGAAQDKDGLLTYSKLAGIKKELSKWGFGQLVESIFYEYSEPCAISEIVQALVSISMAQEVYSEHSNILTKSNGEALNSLRAQLVRYDLEIIELSRIRLANKLDSACRPPVGVGMGPKSTWTELALLNHQASLQKRHAPMRNLTMRAGNALLELKPCWMMSPLSIAQYIPKKSIRFDLVIIDEASQMTPEDSIGALIRADQVLVVGDTNQLPPTDFFKKVFEEEDEEEDIATPEESILEMARAAFRPSRRLRWHYRSRHSGLIAFSNRHIYNDDLIVFPSANEKSSEKGVFHKKIEGIYHSGTNPIEAKAIVDEAISFMKSQIELISTGKIQSLGIVALNQRQKALIEEEFNFVYEQYPWVAQYKDYWKEYRNGLEEFFIKNLENVQGDERDVIFIGTVYGPEKPGARVMQRFGPINGIMGKRRLNVLFSRAKNKIVTFSSMLPSDIQADETSNPGTYMLKQWLEYSGGGKLDAGVIAYDEPDSDFERHVMEQIRAMGFEAIPQVGVSGYFIDIGIRHPDWPYGFIMGVECDGATYHSSKSARDRDLLRQTVLERLGWSLYRIWSTDWFQKPVPEGQKLREALNERLRILKIN